MSDPPVNKDVHKNLPGTRASEMWNWNIRPFAAYEAPLALSEYIQVPQLKTLPFQSFSK